MHATVIETVKAYPGLVATEIAELHPELRLSQVHSTLHEARAGGLIRGEKTDRHQRPMAYYAADGLPDEPMERRVRRVHKTDIPALRARVAELEAWQADALARYPDLAVSANVLKARELLQMAVAGFDDEINKGEWDDHPVMRAMLHGLESKR